MATVDYYLTVNQDLVRKIDLLTLMVKIFNR